MGEGAVFVGVGGGSVVGFVASIVVPITWENVDKRSRDTEGHLGFIILAILYISIYLLFNYRKLVRPLIVRKTNKKKFF